MLRRNWLDLGRKRVDRYDLDFTMNAIADQFRMLALAMFGPGVLVTNLYPDPFPIALAGDAMTGSVGPGMAYDRNGELIKNDAPALPFVIPAADPALPRWDLLVLRYKQVGEIPVPKPLDPIVQVFLNLVDSFDLIVLPGTPSDTPTYRTKGTFDIVLAGIQVPAAAVFASEATLDLSIREGATVDAGTF